MAGTFSLLLVVVVRLSPTVHLKWMHCIIYSLYEIKLIKRNSADFFPSLFPWILLQVVTLVPTPSFQNTLSLTSLCHLSWFLFLLQPPFRSFFPDGCHGAGQFLKYWCVEISATLSTHSWLTSSASKV